MKVTKYIFRKGQEVTVHLESKKVSLTLTEDFCCNDIQELKDYVINNAKPYTCGSCKYHCDENAGYCNYKGEVTKEDIRARAEGRVCSKFKVNNS